MKHASSRALYAYWNRTRGERAAPERSELKPSAISAILGDVLILEADNTRRYNVRLAGTQICSLMGRELAGRDFLEVFAGKDNGEIQSLLDAVAQTATPVVATLVGETSNKRMLGMELLLLPLRHQGKTQTRLLGSLAALSRPFWASYDPLITLRLGSSRFVRHEDTVLSNGDIASPIGRRLSRSELRIVQGGRP